MPKHKRYRYSPSPYRSAVKISRCVGNAGQVQAVAQAVAMLGHDLERWQQQLLDGRIVITVHHESDSEAAVTATWEAKP